MMTCRNLEVGIAKPLEAEISCKTGELLTTTEGKTDDGTTAVETKGACGFWNKNEFQN